MKNLTTLGSAPADPVLFTDRLRLAVAAYLARFTGSSRDHTESDLRCYFAWCAERRLDPLAAQRPHLELYIRWMQEIRRFKPSTVSRRFSVVAGFYRTCVLDSVLPHSPAEHVRRPAVPAESPTLGFTHLQFEALTSAARESANPCDFALVAMLGLLGLTNAHLLPGELHSPADHFGGMQPDDGPGRLTVRAGRICQSLRPAADQHAPRPPRGQHVINYQGDVRIALRVVELPGPGEIPAADVDRVQLSVVSPAKGNDVRHPGSVDGREPTELAFCQIGQFGVREQAHLVLTRPSRW